MARKFKRIPWLTYYSYAEEYYKKTGDINFDINYCIDKAPVGKWLTRQRSMYVQGRLSKDRIELLEALDILWKGNEALNKRKEKQWEKFCLIAKEYFEENGDLRVPQTYVTDEGFQLGSWIHTQRQCYRKNPNDLSKEKIVKLNSIGMVWEPYEQSWNTCYELAKMYYSNIGNLNVPDYYEINGKNLGRWISVQRQAYNGRPDCIITSNQIKKLERIGMLWKGNNGTQTSFYEQISYYYVSRYFKDAISRYKYQGIEIDIYIPSISVGIEYDGAYWHKFKLNEDNDKDKLFYEHGLKLIRIREYPLEQTISATNYILKEYSTNSYTLLLKEMFAQQFNINADIDIYRDSINILKLFKTSANDPWYVNYESAKKYYEENGHLIIDRNYKTISGVYLGKWIANQRQSRKGHHPKALSQEKIDLLDRIDMVWDVNEDSWESNFALACKYYEDNGNLLIPSKYVVNDIKLGKWINLQRNMYNNKKSTVISPERIDKLNSIGMVWNVKKYIWEQNYLLAKEYYERYGNLKIPSNYEVDGIKLGIWIDVQRELKIRRLSTEENQEKIRRLDLIGMLWNVNKDKWNTNYNLAKHFYEENGHLLIPKSYTIDNICLGQWISTLRYEYNAKKNIYFDSEKCKQLNRIGMVWNTSKYAWIQQYNLTRVYYEEHGKLDIPREYVANGYMLGNWIKNQRSAYKRSKLSAEQVIMLNNINMIWRHRKSNESNN